MVSIRIIMKKCMETDKPLIAILMAVYEPKIDWLQEQLLSLNFQTYSNLKLYIRDDCSPTIAFEEIENCVKSCISAFPVEVRRNEENIGSNRTFERLTEEADGIYFAYCDQDDIWVAKKLAVLQKRIEENKRNLLVCSDVYVINEDGQELANSITKMRRHHEFHSGENLADQLIFHNFVIGSTLLVCASMAKQALPFCPDMVHDHYLALFCAEHGRICTVNEPLIKVRFHANNQTQLMAGVYDKESYMRIRIETVVRRLEWLDRYFKCCPLTRREIENGKKWINARKRNWEKAFNWKNIRCMLKYQKYGRNAVLFELFAVRMPDRLFLFIIELARHNYI